MQLSEFELEVMQLLWRFKESTAPELHKEIIEENTLGWEGQEYCVLAYYSLGKLNEEIGNREEAISYYESFLNLWKDADDNIPLLIDCQARYNNLLTDN